MSSTMPMPNLAALDALELGAELKAGIEDGQCPFR